MIFTKALKYEQIAEKLDKENDVITIIGCETCVRVAGVSNEDTVKGLAAKLVKDGYNVEGGYFVPASCTPKVLFTKLKSNVNTIISFSCNAGVSNLIRTFEDKKVITAVEDIGLMIEDSDKHVIKITMPYPGHEDELGKEYQAFTGKKLESDDNISFGRVDK